MYVCQYLRSISAKKATNPPATMASMLFYSLDLWVSPRIAYRELEIDDQDLQEIGLLV